MAGLNSDTKLLLHLNSDFTDSSDSEHTVTEYGTAQIKADVKKFGAGSLWLDGNSDYLTIPDSDDWDIYGSLSEDWTIDFWIYPKSLGDGDYYLVSQADDTSNRWRIILSIGGGDIYLYTSFASGGQIFQGYAIVSMSVDNWYHITFVKVGTTIAMYLNGVQKHIIHILLLQILFRILYI